jgi:hypothetical protein
MIKYKFEEVTDTDHPKDIMKKIDHAIAEIENTIKDLVKMNEGKVIAGVWMIFWNHIIEDFGRWSHNTNKIVRQQIKAFDADEEDEIRMRDKFKCVYAYWWNRFNIIQNKLSKRPGSLQAKVVKKKQIAYINKAGDTLSKLITGEIDHSQVSENFNAAIRSFQTMEPDFEKEKVKTERKNNVTDHSNQ